jgi:hypothetical protein
MWEMTMKDKEIKELLSRGAASRVDFDPSLKNEITRSSLDAMIREIKSTLAKRRKVSVVVVRE